MKSSGTKLPATFTPAGLLLRAAAICVVFLVVHVLGLREATTFLSGTPGTEREGLVYALAWFAVTLVAPPLVIGAGLLRLATWCGATRSPR